MIDPISLTTLSIQHDMQRMSVLANNAANALTTGFKREYLVASSQPSSEGDATRSLGSVSTLSPQLHSVTDKRAGVVKQTSGALDLAIMGEGYFEVQTSTGAAYTRQGNFHLDERGRLVNLNGFPIAGVGGDIVLTSPTPSIDNAGRVFEQGKQVAQIKIVTFSSTGALNNIGGGLLVTTGNEMPQEVNRPRVAQGKLEASNVDSTQEMVRMLETFRHFETSHRVLQAYDEMSDKVLRNLGQF